MSQPSIPIETNPAEVRRRLNSGEQMLLIDVREPSEHKQAAIEGAELIPMRTVAAEFQNIEGRADDARVVVFCHHGTRSLQVVNWLREQGLPNCQSMSGGIDRWSREVDASVPRYS